MDKIINIKDLAFEKHNKPFKIMCPYCNDEAEVMAYKRIKENKLKIIYIYVLIVVKEVKRITFYMRINKPKTLI